MATFNFETPTLLEGIPFSISPGGSGAWYIYLGGVIYRLSKSVSVFTPIEFPMQPLDAIRKKHFRYATSMEID